MSHDGGVTMALSVETGFVRMPRQGRARIPPLSALGLPDGSPHRCAPPTQQRRSSTSPAPIARCGVTNQRVYSWAPPGELGGVSPLPAILDVPGKGRRGRGGGGKARPRTMRAHSAQPRLPRPSQREPSVVAIVCFIDRYEPQPFVLLPSDARAARARAAAHPRVVQRARNPRGLRERQRGWA